MNRRQKHVTASSDQPNRSHVQWDEFYAFCYTVGVRTVRCLKSLVRFTRGLWRPVAHNLKKAGDLLLLRHLRSFRREWFSFFKKSQSTKGEKTTVDAASTRRYRKIVFTAFNVLLPLAALAVLLSTLNYWRRAEYALSLSYQGTPIGYIADETAYADAAALVKDAVINADGSFVIEKAPEMVISVLDDDTLLEKQEICDRILESLGEAVRDGAGLYVNGEFRGALATFSEIQEEMNAILQAVDASSYDGVDFFDEIEIVEGLYPISAFTSEETMKARLKALPVQTVKNISAVEKVKYTTVYEQDSSLPLGYEEVRQKGKDGKQRVYSQIIYVNGKEQYRTVVSTEVVQAVVNRVIRVGAQTYSDNSIIGDGVATGTFIWPLPYTKTISSPFASRWGGFHGAIDIANGSTMGKPIIASDGGTVVEAEYHGSYGYYVLIDHGNGFKTRYAHCSKLEVEAGQKVAQGQYIAKVGNTGYSFGAHLHFEVIHNDKLVDPLDYVQR